MSKGIAALRKFLDGFVNSLGIVLFSMIFLVVLLQIVLRWIFRSPLSWGDELPRYLYIWVCFIGWVYATRNRTHIVITALMNALPSFLKKVLYIFNNSLLIFFAFVMVIYGTSMTLRSVNSPTVTLFFGFAFIYGAAPFSGLMIILYAILNIVQDVVSGKGKSGSNISSNDLGQGAIL
jgi:TRAP-type C4-dicarboxylate transport system permease small subunit